MWTFIILGNMHPTIKRATAWFHSMKWEPIDFQLQAWDACVNGLNGIVNAPTGSGKTYSILLPAILLSAQQKSKGLQIIWITPIRALAKEIKISAERALNGLGLDWEVGIRTGDTATSEQIGRAS